MTQKTHEPQTTHLAPVAAKTELLKPAPQGELTLSQILGGEMIETGFENTSSTDFVMPLLKVLQKLSPELNPQKAQFIKEAKVGQFLDTSTGELLDSVEVIPCLYKPQMVEWKPNRGGFVASHEPGAESGLPRNEKNQFVKPNGNLLIDTRYYYCLRITKTGELIPNILALSSSNIKMSKDWLTKMLSQKVKSSKTGDMVPLPIFINVCKITTQYETKGEHDWFKWIVSLDRHINEKEAGMLKKAQEARTTFQVSAANMRPPMEDDAPGGDENKHL